MKIQGFVALVVFQAIFFLMPSIASSESPVHGSSVTEVVSQISKRLARQGFKQEALINHAAAAASVGLDLPPTQVLFFGSKSFDASLIRRRQTAALDLPLRFLVYEDAEGDIQIDRNDIGFLVDRHELRVSDVKLWFLDAVLDQFGDSDNGVRTVESRRSFELTAAALRVELENRGFRIPLEIDYSERSRRLRPTKVVLFGNPNVGTPLMRSQRGIALDLPQKMLIYETRDGSVRLAYNDPFFLARKHDVIDQNARLGNIASALQSIAEVAAGIE